MTLRAQRRLMSFLACTLQPAALECAQCTHWATGASFYEKLVNGLGSCGIVPTPQLERRRGDLEFPGITGTPHDVAYHARPER